MRNILKEGLLGSRENKKFLESDFPQGQPVSYSAGFILSSGPKTKFYIMPHPELQKGNYDLPKREVKIGNLEAEPSKNYIRLKFHIKIYGDQVSEYHLVEY